MKKIPTSERLKEIMNETGLKQIEIVRLAKPLCEKYNVRLERNDMSQYVSGKVEPGQYKLYILAKTLNVNEAWLMGLDVPRELDSTASNTTTQPPILKKYNSLNTLGQQKADEYIDDLAENPKYRKETASNFGEIAAYGADGTEGDIEPPTEEIT